MKMKFSQEILLSIFLSFGAWVVTSIFDLRASYGDIGVIREDIKIIKTCLINGKCK